MTTVRYEVSPDTTQDGYYMVAIRDHDCEFNDVVFNFGAVEFPDEDQPILRFDYNIIEGDVKVNRKVAFEQTIGDILVELIEQALTKQELIYRGGTDESRNNNPE
jgi:hypothetical protein